MVASATRTKPKSNGWASGNALPGAGAVQTTGATSQGESLWVAKVLSLALAA